MRAAFLVVVVGVVDMAADLLADAHTVSSPLLCAFLV